MSISSTDPFWSALAAYDSGLDSPLVGSTTSAALSSTGSDPNVASAQADASTILPLLGVTSSSSSQDQQSTGATTLLSEVLGGQSSSAGSAVNAAVQQSILDTLL